MNHAIHEIRMAFSCPYDSYTETKVFSNIHLQGSMSIRFDCPKCRNYYYIDVSSRDGQQG